MVAKHCVVSGLVQGVGFRYFIRQRAVELHLSGFARNLSNGSVEVWIQGQLEDVEAMFSYLHTGPLWARVERLDADDVEPDDRFTQFSIQG